MGGQVAGLAVSWTGRGLLDFPWVLIALHFSAETPILSRPFIGLSFDITHEAVMSKPLRETSRRVVDLEFRVGEIDGVLFLPLARHEDDRGWLVELFRHDELAAEHRPQMAYISQTQPGVARGPHEHVDQTDYFAFIGPGDFKLYLWDRLADSPTCGNRLSRIVGQSDRQAVIIPPGVVHAYKNVSDQPGVVYNAPNRLFAGEGKTQPIDEIRHEDDPNSPFVLD